MPRWDGIDDAGQGVCVVPAAAVHDHDPAIVRSSVNVGDDGT